ncbi:PREDICTED: nascent polypeptide-associated complex subunit alpha, muscle-specific form-like, partial [Amphimedon queenslandica]|uniref:Uncharacterized protein n=2 Tax=Amphimedon queenslandica TaxID=400682 RepID=A0AAN0IRY9_AMPQE
VLLQVAGRYRLTDDSRNKLGEYVQKAVRLTRTMLTLLPPTVIYLPLHYNDRLHDTNRATWDEEEAEKNPKLSITHYRPVLLYGNHLHVAVKGLIGKKLESSKRAPPPPPAVTKTQTLSIHSPSNSVLPSAPPPPAVPLAVPLAPAPVTKTQTLSTRAPHYPHPPPPPAVSAPPPHSTKPSIPHYHVDEHQSHSSHSTTEPAHKPKGQRRNRSPSFDKPLSPDKRPKVDERVENPPSLSSRREKVAPSFQHSSATEQIKHKLQQNSVPSRAVPDTQYSSQPPPLVAYLPASQGHSSTQMIEKREGSMSSTPVQTARASHQKQSTYSVSSSNSSYPSVRSGDAQNRMKKEGDTTSGVSAQTTARRTGYEYKSEASKGVTPPTTSKSAGTISSHKETKNINNLASSTSKYDESRPPYAKQKSGKPHSPSAVTKEKLTGGSLKSGTAAATSSSHHLPPTGAGRPSSSHKTNKGNGIHSRSPIPVNKQGNGRKVTPQKTTPRQKPAVFKEMIDPRHEITPTKSSHRLKLKSRPVSGNRNAKENANPPAAITISKQSTAAGNRLNLDSNSRSKISDRGSSYTPLIYPKKVSPRPAKDIMASQASSIKTPMRAVTLVKDYFKSHTTGPSPTDASILPNKPHKSNKGPVRSPIHDYATPLTPGVAGYGGIPLPQGDRPQGCSNSGSRASKYKRPETPRSRPTKIDATFRPGPTIRKPTNINRPTKEQSPVAVSPNPCQTSPVSSTQFIVQQASQQQDDLQHKLRSGATYDYPTGSRVEPEQLRQKRRIDVVLCESRGGGAVTRVQKLQKRK